MHSRELTVGPAGSGAELVGDSGAAIQAAIASLAAQGGGCVRVLAGTYHLDDAIHLHTGVDLAGAPGETILRRGEVVRSPLVIDADLGQQKATVADASPFRVGMGVTLSDEHWASGYNVAATRIVGIAGNTLHFADYLERNYVAEEDKNGKVENAHSLVAGRGVKAVRISGLVIEGLGEDAPPINGCVGGGIYLYKSADCRIENCVVRQFNGDGISWQITRGIEVRNCEVDGATGLGIHPGTGSERSVVEDCHAHHCGNDGLFLCWRVQHGRFERNRLEHNGRFGISIGHKDTDNVFRENVIRENGWSGVFFRRDKASNTGSRNTLEKNLIENNGNVRPEAGVRIRPETSGLVFNGNVIRETREGDARTQLVGFLIEEGVSRVTGTGNEVSGHPEGSFADKSGREINIQ